MFNLFGSLVLITCACLEGRLSASFRYRYRIAAIVELRVLLFPLIICLSTLHPSQVRDSLKMYNSLVSRCFSQCVGSFRGKQLDATETACVTR